jgi:hypothetical protein
MATSEDDNEKDYQVWFYYAGISGSIEVTVQDGYNAVRKATLRLIAYLMKLIPSRLPM